MERGAPDLRHVVDLYTESQAMKKFYHKGKRLAELHKKLDNKYIRDTFKKRVPKAVSEVCEIKDHLVLRRSGALRKYNITNKEFDAGIVGKEMDLGYSSFGPASYRFQDTDQVLIKIPKKEAKTYLDNNMAFEKINPVQDVNELVNNKKEITSFDLFPFENEQEIAVKNYYKIISTHVDRASIRWVVVEPIKGRM